MKSRPRNHKESQWPVNIPYRPKTSFTGVDHAQTLFNYSRFSGPGFDGSDWSCVQDLQGTGALPRRSVKTALSRPSKLTRIGETLSNPRVQERLGGGCFVLLQFNQSQAMLSCQLLRRPGGWHANSSTRRCSSMRAAVVCLPFAVPSAIPPQA